LHAKSRPRSSECAAILLLLQILLIRLHIGHRLSIWSARWCHHCLTVLTAKELRLHGGLSLQKALGQLEKQATERNMKMIVGKMAADLRAGIPLHQALAAHPQVFNQTYVSMIESNEKSGTLDDGLHQIAREIKQQVETRARIQQALVQPAIVVGLAVVVIFILVSFVLPRLTKVFTQFGSTLPASAQLLVNISDFAAAYKAKYNMAIDTYAAHGWDAGTIMTDAMKKAGTDPLKIRDEIEKTYKLIGIDGIYTYSATNHDGLNTSDLIMIKIQNGAWTQD